MARQGALTQNGLAPVARADSTDATHIFQCPLVLPSLLVGDGDRPALRRQDGTTGPWPAWRRPFCGASVLLTSGARRAHRWSFGTVGGVGL